MARIDHTNHPHPATPAGRAACRDAVNVCLADAVDAYRRVIRLSKIRPGSAAWRTACANHFACVTMYATLTGMARNDVAAKVATIVDMLPRS